VDNNIVSEIKNLLESVGTLTFEEINDIRKLISKHSANSFAAIDAVIWVELDSVIANDYNPNEVAPIELKLLLRSIEADSYTQPIVTIYDPLTSKYIIVDGFHRYFVMKNTPSLREKYHNKLPIVVLNKSPNERIASTVRHNRARGKHTITGMSNIVFEMLDNGWDDARICNELGLEPEELLKLKHLTGFSKLFENIDYRKAWTNKNQILYRLEEERMNEDN